MSNDSTWYETAAVDAECWNGHGGHRCSDCQPDGFCETCDTFEGRWIEAINEYASTCDGCAELTHHDLQRIDPDDGQKGYCENCRPDLFSIDATND